MLTDDNAGDRVSGRREPSSYFVRGSLSAGAKIA